MYQRIKFISKSGHPMDMAVQIVKKQSKVVIAKNLEDDSLMTIPRNAVESILSITKEEKEL